MTAWSFPTADDHGCLHKEWTVQDILEHIAPDLTRDEIRHMAKLFRVRIGQSSAEKNPGATNDLCVGLQ
jgi:hypothetical protein